MGLFGSKSDDNSKDVFSRLGKEVKEDMMVNTLEDNDLAKLAAGMKSELTGSVNAEVTPNCRMKCSGCGVAKWKGGVCVESKN
mgnify:CR=1 FL=1